MQLLGFHLRIVAFLHSAFISSLSCGFKEMGYCLVSSVTFVRRACLLVLILPLPRPMCLATQTLVYVVDTPRTANPTTFMSNMLYACSVLYKSRLPLVLALNKVCGFRIIEACLA